MSEPPPDVGGGAVDATQRRPLHSVPDGQVQRPSLFITMPPEQDWAAGGGDAGGGGVCVVAAGSTLTGWQSEDPLSPLAAPGAGPEARTGVADGASRIRMSSAIAA